MKNKLADAPIGTKAPATFGGYWIKVDGGWKWCTGAIFPCPGGDWTGELIYPSTPTGDPHNPVASSRDGRV